MGNNLEDKAAPFGLGVIIGIIICAWLFCGCSGSSQMLSSPPAATTYSYNITCEPGNPNYTTQVFWMTSTGASGEIDCRTGDSGLDAPLFQKTGDIIRIHVEGVSQGYSRLFQYNTSTGQGAEVMSVAYPNAAEYTVPQ